MDNQFSPPTNNTDEDKVTIPVTNNSSSSPSSEPEPVPPVVDEPKEDTPTTPSEADSSEKPALAAPTVTSTKVSPDRGRRGLTMALFVLLIVIVIAAILGIYEWQHKKVNTLNAQVTTLSAQVSTQSSTISKLKTQSAATSSTSSSASSTSMPNTSTFKITELGVSFQVPYTLSDLKYAVTSSANTAVNLSTTNLGILDPNCATSATNTKALGTISKVTGTYTSSSSTQLIKQYSSYYYMYTSPTGVCSTVSNVSTLINSLIPQLKTSFGTVQTTTS